MSNFYNSKEIDTFVNDTEVRIRYELQSIENDTTSLLAVLSQFEEAAALLSRNEIEAFKSRADKIQARLVSLKNFAVSSMHTLFSRSNEDLQSYSRHKATGFPFATVMGGTQVIPLLSEVFFKIKCLSDNDSTKPNKHKEWVPPSIFDRSTHKYWIQEANLVEVMLLCLREVPLLVYGKETSEVVNVGAEEDIWNTISTSITSIYFDSPGSMILYKGRIARVESAQLFRIRWYGKKPSGNELIYLELKTHHEQWVQQKSVKERVALKACDLTEVLQRDGRRWTKDMANIKVTNAKPGMRGKELEDAVALLLRIRKMVIKKNLQPRVRSTYRRVAFQSNTNNDLRFTIDRDIELSSEESASLGTWSRLENEYAKTVTMPVGVFEVKLGGVEAPKWVDTLLGKGIIQDGHKFSKYLSGASILFQNDVRTLPYWAEYPLFRKIYNGVADSETNCKSDSDITRLTDDSENVPLSQEQTRSIFQKLVLLFPFYSTDEKVTAPKVRAKIEPKTYFAAERTFIQWISAALLLVTISALLFTYGESSTDANAKFLLFVAIFLAFYALAVYFRRLHLMTKSKPYGYTDHIAPIVLTISIIIGVGSILYHASPSNRKITLRESKGKCQQVPYSGISFLEFQPSDIAIDSERHHVYVPSTSDIIMIDLEDSVHEVRSLSSIKFSDFEAVVLVGDVLFAVSEHSITEPSKLFAFEIVGSKKPKLELVGSWKLGNVMKGTESIAYRQVDGKEQLLISSYDALTSISQIHIFEVPKLDFFEGQELFPISRLNEKVMSNGITDTKIASMQVFEDKLYVLFDNEMVIRSFDLKSGQMHEDVRLPSVGDSYDKQWEGLSFERVQRSRGKESNLRGASMMEGVILHLALDSPPQIWQFSMNEKKDGTFSFPKCAAA